MNRDDSTMTSLRELLALETARLEAERLRDIEQAQARAEDARRAREAAEHAALEALEARERESRDRRDRESAAESARAARELESRLRAEHEAKMQAMDARLAAERARVEADARRAAAQKSRSTRAVLAGVALLVAGLGAAGAWASSRIDASIRDAHARADRAAAAERAARESTPIVPTIAPVVAAQPSPSPIAQLPTARPARPRPNWRAQPAAVRPSTNDPFSQLSSIDRGAGPINGTDR